MGPLHSCVCACAGVLWRSMGYSGTVSLFSLGRLFVLQAAGEALLFNLVKRIILKVKAFNSTVGLHCSVVNAWACKRLWMCVCVFVCECYCLSLHIYSVPRLQGNSKRWSGSAQLLQLLAVYMQVAKLIYRRKNGIWQKHFVAKKTFPTFQNDQLFIFSFCSLNKLFSYIDLLRQRLLRSF